MAAVPAPGNDTRATKACRWALGRIWVLNPRAYKELAPHGKAVGIPFLLLAGVLASAGIGWFKRRRWGWRVAVAVFATQVLGNLVNIFMGDLVRGGIGFLIAGALFLYLLRPQLRSAFASGETSNLSWDSISNENAAYLR